MENWINLRQERDFGEKFNATFTFARQNLKKLFVVLLFLGSPLMIASTLLNGYLQTSLRELLLDGEFGGIIVYYGLIFGVSIIAQSWLNTITLCYIAEYLEGNRNISINSVFKRAGKKIALIIGANLITGIFVALGTMLFIVPGIYLIIALCFVNAIIIFEKISIMEAISRSINLIKENWFSTLGLLIIIAIVIMLMQMVFNIPLYIYIAVSSLSGQVPEFSIAYILTMIFATLGSALIYPLLYITIAFQYFNLVEHKESAGLKSEIDNIAQQQTTENKGNEGEY